MALLEEPEVDEARLHLDHQVVQAVRARLAAGAHARPDAAAIAMRAVLENAGGPAAAALKAVWGRLDAATGSALVVAGGAAQVLAADRFGLNGRLLAAEDALKAVEAGSRALMDMAGDRPWWGRLLARADIRIVGALPDDRRGRPRAFLVDRTPSGPTGDDRSFWVTDSGWTDARIVQALGEAGLVAEPLTAAGGLKLFMLAGYVQPEDGRLTNTPGRLTGVIGAAPIF